MKVDFWGHVRRAVVFRFFSTHLLLTYCILLRSGDVECQTVFPNNFNCWNDLLKGSFRFSLTSEVEQ